jgi:predicted Zn-dependent protease
MLSARVPRWGLVLGLLAALALAGYVGFRWVRDRSERQEALGLAEQGRFDAAEPRLQTLAEHRPEDVEIVRALALGYLRTGRDAQAETFLDRWCQAASGSVEPYQQRLDWLVKQQRMPQALDDARHVLQLNPGDQAMRRKLATLLLMNGHYSEAEAECRRSLDAAPGDPNLGYMLATIYQRQGKFDAAADVADRVLRAQPDFTRAMLLRGELHLEAKQPEAAVPLLRKAADVQSPVQIEALYQLSVALARVGRDKDAQQVVAEMQWRQALELWAKDTQRDTNLVLQGRVVDALLAAGHMPEAIRFLNNIVRESPSAAAPHQLLASLYEKQGQPERAAEHRRRAGLKP